MQEYKVSKQFIKNVISGPLKIVLNAVVVFFSYRYFLHVFGFEKYSVWLLLSVVIEFSKMGNLGINDIIIKYVAEARSADDEEKICEYVSASIAIICIFCLVIGIVLYLFENIIPGLFNIPNNYLLLFENMYMKVLALSFLIILMEFFLGILYGLGRADIANYLQFFSVFFGTILSIILVFLNFDFMGLFYGNLFGISCVVIVSIYNICRILSYFPFKLTSIKKYIVRNILKSSSIMFSASIMNLFFLPAGKILVSRYIGSVEVVSYDLAFKLSFQIRALFDLALKALVSEFSTIKNDNQKIVSLLKKIYKYLIITAIPIFTVIFIFSKEILILWLSKAYIESLNESFCMILLGVFLNLYAVPIYYLFLGKGYFSKLLTGYLIQSITTFCVSLFYFIFFQGHSYQVFLYINVLAMVLATIYLWAIYYKYIVCNKLVMERKNEVCS